MKLNTTYLRLTAAFIFTVTSSIIFAQNVQDNQNALTLVKKNAAALGLSDNNILNSRVADTYIDAISGATLVYLQQTYMGYDVDKSLLVLAFKNGSLVSSSGKRIEINFLKNTAPTALQKKSATPSINAEAAIQAATQHLHLPAPLINQRPAANQNFSTPASFGDLGVAKENVTTRLLWIPQQTFERVKLVWEVNIAPKGTSDYWRVIVDAKAGNVIKKENYTVTDDWSNKRNNIKQNESMVMQTVPADNSKEQAQESITSVTYRVIPFPVEAPTFPNGSPSLVTNPWNLLPAGSRAAPFIWNDNGSKQFHITWGNNVLSQEDQNGNDSIGKRAKATQYQNNLYFDYMPRFGRPPTDSINQGFAITNLFYWNNIMHDLSYQYGFNEVSGNFQENNLSRGGKGHDYVFADAQDGIGFDNANFSTPPDGHSPRMQMFLFDANPLKGFKINSPASIARRIVSVESDLSPNNKLEKVGPVTADVVVYRDASDTLANGCVSSWNKKQLNGKIALINRGSCNFTDKILNAQKAGAIAVVVVDNIPGESPFIMGGLDSSIVIPAVMISYEDGLKIKDVLHSGTAVNVTLSFSPYLDGDLDAGVISHEYTHGISNRLTGGPSNVACLQNAEQMGEGWSDYIALMTITDWSKAHKNDGNMAKGLGTYVSGQSPNGPGIRQYPYSIDMSINPHTYADVAATGGEPHAVGEIWASILWDMTWFIIQQDGINPDIFKPNGIGGNSVAYKLVMLGMKLQPCSPGFVDGRDAILKADTLLYNGKYSCTIWKAFARRGVGVGASEGNSNIAGDETVDFSEGAIFITKHGNKSALPGNQIVYTIGLKAKAVCNGTVRPNYSVTDSLPSNVTYLNSDGIYHPSNRTVTFNNINMSDGDSLTYKVKVKVNDNTWFPDSVYLYDAANTPDIAKKWAIRNGKHLAWGTLNLGIYLYYSNDASVKDDETLVTNHAYIIPGVKTTFTFFHEIVSDDFNNGAVIEITSDSGKTWEDLGPYMDPSGVVYNETITGNSVLKGRRAFSGFSFGYTSIDLSAFAGKRVKIRFRYATSDNSFSVPDGGTGWIIDDISLSATALISNTAKLFNGKRELKGWSTVVTKIKEGKANTDFVAVKHDETQAWLTWHKPGELNGTYLVERSADNGVTFKSIGTVKTMNNMNNNSDVQSYSFADASPAEGLNLYRIHHISRNGAVDYTDIKALTFDLKTIQVYPNPARDKVKINIPGNDGQVIIQLTDGSGKQIKNYQAAGKDIELRLPGLSRGVYYLNIIKSNGTSTHKLVIE